jgi:hypothetical protein
MKATFLLCLLFALPAFAQSPMRMVSGLKFPNDPSEGSSPVRTEAMTLTGEVASYPGFSELLQFAQRSPHQEEAGSCLYMSLTGAAEFLWNQSHPGRTVDLSERYLMNFSDREAVGSPVVNWKTDSAYLFNMAGKIPTNDGYRFTKGWAAVDGSGNYVKAPPLSPGAFYDTRYNWIDESSQADPATFITLPRFAREILFADPASDQWNVAVMPATIVETIKAKLHERRAPVHVIYNHFGYWHAVDILGYDDEGDTKNCAFVRKFMTFMEARVLEYRDKANQAVDQDERDRLNRIADKSERISLKVNKAFNEGGCSAKGVFYVRDSIYSDTGAPLYDYDLTQTGDEGPYAKTIVLHEYEWVKYMANHATQIYLE